MEHDVTQMRDGWALPPELDQPVPRTIFPTSARWKTLTLPCAIVIPMALLFFFTFYSKTEHAATLEKTGKSTAATIEDLYTRRIQNNTDYDVDYSYSVNQHTYQGFTAVTQDKYESLKIGDYIQAIYDPADPKNSNLAVVLDMDYRNPWETFFVISTGASFFFGALASVFFIPMQLRFLKERRLLKWGRATSANIVDETKVKSIYGSFITVTYAFLDSESRVVHGKSDQKVDYRTRPYVWTPYTFADLQASPTVLFDPKRPSKSFLYPSYLVTCEKEPG